METPDLIDRLRSGDPTAVDEMVTEYRVPVFAFIMRMIGDRDRADDLFQETWLKAIRAVGNFRGGSKLSTWLFQIALNCCRDAMRKKSRQPFVSIDDLVVEPGRKPDADPERILAARAVREMLAELPDVMREVVVLKYYHELTDPEIAGVAGCPEGTVKSRLHRASGLLREKWMKRQDGWMPDG